jgi:hypothetical protein
MYAEQLTWFIKRRQLGQVHLDSGASGIALLPVRTDDKRLIPGFEQFFESKSLCTSTNVPLLWTGAGLASRASSMTCACFVASYAVARCAAGAHMLTC